MISVIITLGDARRLPGLLAALTPAAVEGLVGDLQIVGGGQLVEALCDDTGAEPAESLQAAIAAARSDWLLIAPPGFRPRDGWLETLVEKPMTLRGRALFGAKALLKKRIDR